MWIVGWANVSLAVCELSEIVICWIVHVYVSTQSFLLSQHDSTRPDALLIRSPEPATHRKRRREVDINFHIIQMVTSFVF
jgi:hypothetical protein